MEVRTTIVANIHVGERLRKDMDEGTVTSLMESIKELGLQSPISIIYQDGLMIDGDEFDHVPVLVAGRHRLEALRRLKVVTTDVIVFSDPRRARMWEISENLHRAKHLKKSEVVKVASRKFVGMVGEILDRGVAAGAFRAGVSPVQLNLTIAAIGYYYITNRFTGSIVFERDLMAKEALEERLQFNIDTILRLVARDPIG